MEYCGPDSWKKVGERSDVDLIYNCTHWQLHTPIAVYAMEPVSYTHLDVYKRQLSACEVQ